MDNYAFPRGLDRVLPFRAMDKKAYEKISVVFAA
jgi:hypothetical protein